ncbi:hypothetical protein JCM21900_001540 [Sporobolomyces salmonicolor]
MHRNSTLFLGYVPPVAQSCSSYSVLVESAFPPYQLDAVLLPLVTPASHDLSLSPDQVLSSLGEFSDWRRWHGYQVNAEPGTSFVLRARDAKGQVRYAETQQVVPGGHRECANNPVVARLPSSPSLRLRVPHHLVQIAFAVFLALLLVRLVLGPLVHFYQKRRMGQKSWFHQQVEYKSPVAPKRRTFDV